MRYIRYAVLTVLALVMVTVALANRGTLTLRLLPAPLTGLFGFSWQVTLPAFIVLLGAVLVGVLLGFVWEWIREHKHRAAAVTERRAREKLERAAGGPAKEPKGGDDVLALLDGR